MDVSIIIVNYNTKDLLYSCIKSIYEKTNDIQFEIIVSDNGSVDGSIEMLENDYPEVILLKNNANLGFGTANNRGLDIAKGKYIFFLNSDTLLVNNAIKYFFDYWENSKEKDTIGALGTNLINKENEFMCSYGMQFPTYNTRVQLLLHKILVLPIKQIFTFFHIEYKKEISTKKYSTITGEVACVSGADLFMKNNSNARFDERFFLYCEEVDLEYKLYKKGLKRIIIDGPEIIHLEGASSNANSKSLKSEYFGFSKIQDEISNVRFIKYHFGNLKAFVLKILVSIFWLNPIGISDTRKYYKILWSI